MDKKELLEYCLLYKGEKSILDNPVDKDIDEFKWYMWRIEYAAVNMDPNNANEEYIKNEIKCAIDNWACTWAGGDPIPYYTKYFDYSRWSQCR